MKRVLKDRGTKPSDFLPYLEDGKTISPYYDIITAAKASINTFTKFIPDTNNGRLGCAAGVSIIYMRAFGHNADYNISLILRTSSFYSILQNDKKNWRPRKNWKDALPGDIINTVTVKVGFAGHIGVVVDTKINDNKYKSWDIVSNAGGGYVGATGKENPKLAGSIQSNYSITSWERDVSKRKFVGPTIAYEFIGKIEETIGYSCCSKNKKTYKISPDSKPTPETKTTPESKEVLKKEVKDNTKTTSDSSKSTTGSPKINSVITDKKTVDTSTARKNIAIPNDYNKVPKPPISPYSKRNPPKLIND